MTATVIGDLFVRLGLDATELNNNLGAAEKRLDKFGTQLFFLGSRITAGISLPLGAAMTAIADFGLGFDKAMTESLAIMDNVSAEMRKSMEDTAKMVSETTKFSAQEAAKGYYGLASAGLDAATSMGALPVAARFAQAGVMDLAKATDFLSTAQAAMATGTQSSAQKVADMARVADVLTMANNKAIGTIQDFAEALTNKAGAALRQSNKTIEEGVAVLMAYASVGIKGKEAGQQLWMSIRDLGIAALKHRDAFAKFGITVFDSTGAMKNMADIIGDLEKATDKMSVAERRNMFLKLGMPSRSIAATTALLGLSGAIKGYQKDVENAGGVTQTVADKQMQALSNQLLQLGNRFKNAAIDLFSTFVPVIRETLIPLLVSAVEKIQDFTAWFSGMPDSVKLATLAVLGFGVALGPVIAMIGSMTLLTSASFRGIGLLASGFGQAAVSMGLWIGPSSMLAKFLTFMPKQAALAAAAAYDLAKANGVAGMHLNRAATAAANAAGWHGRVTNALIAQSTATAAANGTMLTGITTLGKFGAITAVVGSAILATQAYTKDWGETLKVWTIPGYGVFTLLSDLNNKLIDHGGVIGDLARIVRSTTSIMWDAVKTTFDNMLKAVGDFVSKAVDLLTQWVDFSIGSAIVVANALPGGSILVKGLIAAKLKFDELKAGLPALTRTIHNVADAMDRVAGYGTFKGKAGFTPDLLTGGLAPFNMPRGPGNPFSGKPTSGPPNFGDMPDLDPKKMTAAQSAAKNLADQWQENSKQVRAFRDAWASLTPVQQRDSEVMEHAWESYDRLRQKQGVLIPQFEKLFAAQIEQQELQKELTYSLNEYSVVWSDAAIKFEDDAGKVYLALSNIKDKASLDAFWKKNASVMEEVIPLYHQASPLLQVLVNRYQDWAKATNLASGALQDLQKKGLQSLGDFGEKAAAGLKDAQDRISMITQSGMDQEIMGLKKGLAEKERVRKNAYNEQLANIALLANNPALLMVELAKLNAADRINKQINVLEQREGLLRLGISLGINKRIIQGMKDLTNEEIAELLKRRQKWLEYKAVLDDVADTVSGLGSAFSALGREDIGATLSAIGSGLSGVTKGLETFAQAKDLAGQLNGLVQIGNALITTFKQISTLGTRTQRAASGALSGAMSGAAIGGMFGPVGAGIGAAIGGIGGFIAGLVMKDPGWKKVQQTVQHHWNTKVSKALADQIDKDSKVLGGHVNSMLMHMMDIVNENGGLKASNVGNWASKLAMVFPLLDQGMMDSAQAAKTLDASFNDLLSSGTTTSGLINDQIRDLVLLEQKYKTGSKAIKEFVDAQMAMISGGFNKVVSGAFGALLPEGSFDVSASLKRQQKITEQISALKDEMAELNKKEVKTEEEKMSLLAKQFQLNQLNNQLARERNKAIAAGKILSQMSGPEGQETFNRLGRLASITFNAMIGSGKSFLDALTAIGPALDMLSAAQQTFGFTSTETFTKLMKFRDFAAMNPELVDAISGLQEMMVGLSNTGFLTQEAFMDLGAEVTSTFDKLIAQGLSGDEAMMVMQPTLQTLWELQRKFGHSVDEATQKLIDEAVASGTVGEAYMSANDRMILGIDKLISRFDAFLKHLGIDIPGAAEDAAGAINQAGDHVDPWYVPVIYDDQGRPTRGEEDTPPEMARGGILMGPRHVIAGEAGPEAIIPLDRLFDEVAAMRASEGDGTIHATFNVEGEPFLRAMIKTAKKNGWTR